MYRRVALLALVSSVATAAPLGHVQVTFKRTLTEAITARTPQGDKCTDVVVSSTNFVETVTLGSESYPISDDGNDISFQSGATVTGKVKPLTGSATYEYAFDSHRTSCGLEESSKLKAHAAGKVDEAFASAQYSRKSHAGMVAVSPALKATTSSGMIKSRAAPNPETTVPPELGAQAAASNGDALAASFGVGNLNTAAQWSMLGGAASGMQMANEMMASDEPMSVTADNNGATFTLTESKSIPLAKLFPAGGNTQRTGTHVVTTELTIQLGDTSQFEAILEPLASAPGAKLATYESFLPVGELPKKPGRPAPDTTADSVGFRVYIIDKKDPSKKNPRPFDVTYTLESSHEPGIALNLPTSGGNSDPDLEWSPAAKKQGKIKPITPTTLASTPDNGASVLAIVRSRDFGAYGKLTAEVQVKNGPKLAAHLLGKTETVARIPVDNNDNHIADAWEASAGVKAIDMKWDEEHFDGDDHNGDGIMLYEEYRGVLEHGEHHRLDPNKKDVFIVNTSGLSLKAGATYFETAAEKSVVVHILDPDELDTGTLVINTNTSIGKPQHAVKVVRDDSIATTKNPATGKMEDTGVAAQAVGKKNAAKPGRSVVADVSIVSPGDTDRIDVAGGHSNLPYKFAHELGHTLGIRHHGKPSQNTVANYSRDTFDIVEEDGVPSAMTSADPTTPVAGPYSEASGDVDCIMAYNQWYELSSMGHVANDVPALHTPENDKKFPKGNAVWSKLAFMHTSIAAPAGTKLCHSRDGTGRNAKNPKPPQPWSAFGDASSDRGNCWSQLRVKDWE